MQTIDFFKTKIGKRVKCTHNGVTFAKSVTTENYQSLFDSQKNGFNYGSSTTNTSTGKDNNAPGDIGINMSNSPFFFGSPLATGKN